MAKKYRQFFIGCSICLFAMYLLFFSLERLFGDGDGIIANTSFDPFLCLVLAQITLGGLIATTISRKWVSNGGLLLLSILFSVGIAEIGLRFWVELDFQREQQIENLGRQPILSKYDTAYFKNYLPYSRFITHVNGLDGNFSVYNEINSDGIRGPELIKKKKGERRILLLGDSFMQADEINFEDCVGQKLQRLLPDSIQVIEHGVPSWSPLLELNWLLKKGLSIQPDRVILFLYYNDFLRGYNVGDEGYTHFTVFDDTGLPVKFSFRGHDKQKPWNRMVKRLWNLEIGKLVNLILNGAYRGMDPMGLLNKSADEFERDQRNHGAFATMRDTSIWDQATRKRVDLSLHYLQLMQSVLQKRGIAFNITLVPHPWQFSDENLPLKTYFNLEHFSFPESGLALKIEKFCQEKDIPFIPMYPTFKSAKNEKGSLFYFPNDGHWNENGHQLAAEVLYAFLKAR
jgi:hypothetical protein